MFVVIFMQNGISPLMIACSRGDNAIVQLLLNNNANINLQALVCLLADLQSHGTHFALQFFLQPKHTSLHSKIFVFSTCLLFKSGETAVE